MTGFKYLISCDADKESILDVTKGFFFFKFSMIMIKISSQKLMYFAGFFFFAVNLPKTCLFHQEKLLVQVFYFSFNAKIRKRFDKTAPTAASTLTSSAAAAAAAVVNNLSYLPPALFFVFFFRAASRSHFPLSYLFIRKKACKVTAPATF